MREDDDLVIPHPEPTFVSYATAMKVEQEMLDDFLRDAHEYRVWLKTPRVRFWVWVAGKIMDLSCVIERLSYWAEPSMRKDRQ